MSESVQPRYESMHSEAMPEPDRAERVGALLDRVMGSGLSDSLTDNQRAAIAWHAANGDRERAHTTRVFLKKPRLDGADPIICVYVDNHSFLTDLSANRDLYLARLANWGFFVSGIEFGVDRDAHRTRTRGAKQETRQQQPSSAHLNAEQQRQVQELASKVPDSLKESVSKAIAASFLAESEK